MSTPNLSSTFVEGIGDEVVIFSVAIGILIFLLLGWLSTHVPNEPHLPDGQRNLLDNNDREATITGIVINFTSNIWNFLLQGGPTDHIIMAEDDDYESSETDEENSASIVASNSPNNHQPNNSITDPVLRVNEPTSVDLATENLQPSAPSANHPSNTGLEPPSYSSLEPFADSTPLADAGRSNNASSTTPLSIRVKIKFLNETERIVVTDPTLTISRFTHRYFAAEVLNDKLVRFVFNGRQLSDSATLTQCNISDNTVIHCLISDKRPEQQAQPQQQARGTGGFRRISPLYVDEDVDIGVFMLPLFGLLLACIWYLRFTYRGLFNSLTTFILLTFTFVFVIACIVSLRAPHQRSSQESDAARR